MYKFYALNHFLDRWTDFSVSVNANERRAGYKKKWKNKDEQIKPTEIEEETKEKEEEDE